jgi:hypothetical protein
LAPNGLHLLIESGWLLDSEMMRERDEKLAAQETAIRGLKSDVLIGADDRAARSDITPYVPIFPVF